ncbi:MAG TPA: glycosyltransferase family 61 protein [Pseudomonadales bacterium]|nr:glycosyltransferase family 61 protein [Pseudomonadales bacterium]
MTAIIGGQSQPLHPLTVVELADGKVIGSLRLAATRNDVVIGGVQNVFGCDDLENHSALRQRRFRLSKYRRGTALLLGAPSSDLNYYHWMMDSLPRLKISQAANYRNYDYVLLQNRSLRFQDEFLDHLAVPPAKRLRCSKNIVHQFERLIVPGMPISEWKVSPWVCAWLRSLFPANPSGPEKIYISRREAKRRRLINEAELERALQAMGFVSIQPEQLKVVEQARLFSSAKCVVGAHGAGLANMVFAPPNALLVELFHPDTERRPCYQHLAASAGQRYASVIGQRTQAVMPGSEDDAEYKVDTLAVTRAVEENGKLD